MKPGFTLSCLWAAAAAIAGTANPPAAAGLVAPDADHRPLPGATAACSRGELIACYSALGMKPNDPALLVAEADALVASKHPGEAIGVYRNALRSGARRDVVEPRIAAAAAQRGSFLVACENSSGAQAELACESAWLPGAPDEVAVFKRRGLLLSRQSLPDAALDAYLAAARLAPHDRAVARSIIDLSESVERSDAATLTARGAALLTLGRPAQAAVLLHRALQAAPNTVEAKVLLRTAQHALPTSRQVSRAPPENTATDASTAAGTRFSNAAPVTRTN